MGQMLKIRVKAKEIDFGTGILPDIPELDMLGRFKVHIVKMVFDGDVKGAFFFIINDHEVDLINSVCLPEQFQSEIRTENKLMKHGFMSEIENVIAALSVKEISEFLGAQIQLKVPEITIMKGVKINDYLFRENRMNGSAFYVSSVLEGLVVNVSPMFIWMLDDSFIHMLKLNS